MTRVERVGAGWKKTMRHHAWRPELQRNHIALKDSSQPVARLVDRSAPLSAAGSLLLSAFAGLGSWWLSRLLTRLARLGLRAFAGTPSVGAAASG